MIRAEATESGAVAELVKEILWILIDVTNPDRLLFLSVRRVFQLCRTLTEL